MSASVKVGPLKEASSVIEQAGKRARFARVRFDDAPSRFAWTRGRVVLARVGIVAWAAFLTGAYAARHGHWPFPFGFLPFPW